MRYSCALSGFVGSLLITWAASAVTMAWTSIGNPGNAVDPTALAGAVGYAYQIGTYEVTNAQYTEFLNAKAASDPLGLYDLSMGPLTQGGIWRNGVSGSYSYSATAGRQNMPVNWVSFYNAARFANWMNNGQGNADTETGAYTLLGGTPIPSNGDTMTRNAGATIVLPSENEWYKAAFYDSISMTYYAYPTRSDTVPTCTAPGPTPNAANCDYAIYPNGGLTPVGSYSGSASPYGTFDQGGNVWEWSEKIVPEHQFELREIIGGDFTSPGSYMGLRAKDYPDLASTYNGFRLAMIPEPSTGLLVIAGLLGLAGRRRVRA